MVARARAAQAEWEAIGFAGRRRWLESLRDWILDHQDELDDRMQEESGKVRADAALEAFYLLDAINFWCDRGPRFLADETVTPHVPLLRHRRAKISTTRTRSPGSSAPGTSRSSSPLATASRRWLRAAPW